MSFKIVVLVKQVPDTNNITGEAMKADGTVNRGALPAIFNPDDLHALEAALAVKDAHGGTHITVISMGPPGAVKVLKEAIYRGANTGILVSDRRFAAADTLATSYALSCAIRKLKGYDIVFAGRQAIDGDTAQVGPQTAEKLGINQITYVSKIESISEKNIIAIRSIEGGYERVRAHLPVLMTFTDENYFPRPPSAKLLMSYKNAAFSNIEEKYDSSYLESEARGAEISEIKLWNIESIDADVSKCGLAGSPTKVKKVESVVLKSGDIKMVDNSEPEISEMIHELVADHTLG